MHKELTASLLPLWGTTILDTPGQLTVLIKSFGQDRCKACPNIGPKLVPGFTASEP
jgi:hypothetical protein